MIINKVQKNEELKKKNFLYKYFNVNNFNFMCIP